MSIEKSDCPNNPAIKSFVTEDKTYDDLCGKILLEAKYLDALDVPHVYRDLFSEMGETKNSFNLSIIIRRIQHNVV